MWYRHRTDFARWALWALLLALALVLQATVCSHLKLMGVMPLLLPVAAVCVAMMGSAEFGAVIGLAAGLIGYLGGDALAFTIPALCFAGALAGGLCSRYFTRSLPPALLLSAIALLVCELPAWMFRTSQGYAPPYSVFTVLLPELVYSLLYAFPLYWLSWRISLLGKR